MLEKANLAGHFRAMAGLELIKACALRLASYSLFAMSRADLVLRNSKTKVKCQASSISVKKRSYGKA